MHALEARDDVQHVDLSAERDVLLEPGRPVGASQQRLVGIGPRVRDRDGCLRRVALLGVEQLDDPAGAIGVVQRERALEPGAQPGHVLPTLPSGARHGAQVQQAPEIDLVAASRGSQDRTRPVGRREDDRLVTRLEELTRRGPDVEALEPRPHSARRPADPCRAPAQGNGVLHLTAAENTLVPRAERLRDGRRGAQNIDDDADRRRDRLRRRERDVYSHWITTLLRPWTR